MCASGKTHAMKENSIVAIKLSTQKNIIEFVIWALNKLMILAKINAKCAMDIFHPSLPLFIHINNEENTRGEEGI